MPGTDTQATAFIERWQKSEGSERGNYQTFLSELCDLLEVPRPDPAVADDAANAYVFDRTVTSRDGKGGAAPGFIDLYKRDCFILEAKQGSETPAAADPDDFSPARPRPRPRKTRIGTARRGTARWDQAMLAARGQAERYARSLPPEEGNPPLLITCDIGHTFELYADFSRLGRTYTPYPDPANHRIHFQDLADGAVRETLALAWTDPLALDPSRRSAAVTRDIADRLALLSRSLERGGEDAEAVAEFLMRVLFTLFAEDIGLLPKGSFTDALKRIESKPELFAPMAEDLWAKMNTGGYAGALCAVVLRFNGGLFERNHAIALDADQLGLLIRAAEKDWTDVEPAIFGTLLERALNPRERHKLGAHYTPRAYVERLVLPTVIEPLRERWSNAKAAAVTLDRQGKPKEARAAVSDFLDELCNTTVLDPACGSGNFLYVTLEHMKRLEAEVRQSLVDLGGQDVLEGTGLTVDPHLLLGIELNPRAAAIADLVLWIGHLQWHHRTSGGAAPAEPVLRRFDNIECRDAVLAYDEKVLNRDDAGQPVTRWDGRTTKQHPVTGEAVPDESAREVTYTYVNPRQASWPEASYVVGNPPFIGKSKMRRALGDGYTEAVREAYSELPASIDFVMYWWHLAAVAVRSGRIKRFGFITTNGIRQSFNRRLIDLHVRAKKPISIPFAIPDHPWVDGADGAQVRVSISGGIDGRHEGQLRLLTSEEHVGEEEVAVQLDATTGFIFPNLQIGPDLDSAKSLRANEGLSCPGVKLHGSGFIVSPEVAAELATGSSAVADRRVRPYMNGRDVQATSRDVKVIDLYGLTAEEVRSKYPAVYQHVLSYVKPERDQNRSDEYRENWWIFGRARGTFRPALRGLRRYIVTTETSKHRLFVFLDEDVLADNKLIVIAMEDGFSLGVLSSSLHVIFARATGGWLGVGNDSVYVKSACFDQFPFPDAEEQVKRQIESLAEEIDAHRKRQQAAHPKLTLTNVYNVLEKLRSGEALSPKEKTTHEQGLVSVLKQLHDDLDAAVFAAYGWSDLWAAHLRGEGIDEPLLERLVALNAERAAEEATGHVRWLRPDFQNPKGSSATADTQSTLALPDAPTKKKPGGSKKLPWPDSLPAQTAALKDLLLASPEPLTPEAIAATFARSAQRVPLITEICETLTSLGLATATEDAAFAA